MSRRPRTDLAEEALRRRADVVTPEEAMAALARLARFSGITQSDPWAVFPPIMKAADVARALGVEKSAVCSAAQRGHIPMVKRLGQWMIDQVELRRWAGAQGLAPEAASR